MCVEMLSAILANEELLCNQFSCSLLSYAKHGQVWASTVDYYYYKRNGRVRTIWPRVLGRAFNDFFRVSFLIALSKIFTTI